MNIVMFGAPGAGKGTHADLLAGKYNLAHISTGELLRKEVSDQTLLGKEIQEMMDRGELVPDSIVEKLVERFVSSEPLDIIFDGFPRTVSQAKSLDQLLKIHSRTLDCVVSIEVPHDELVRRMHERALISHRSDDNEETLSHRLTEYENKTLPVLEYYKSKRNLVLIDGSGTIAETSNRVIQAMDVVHNEARFAKD